MTSTQKNTTDLDGGLHGHAQHGRTVLHAVAQGLCVGVGKPLIGRTRRKTKRSFVVVPARTAMTASCETSGRAESWMQTTEAPSLVWLKPLNTESCRSLSHRGSVGRGVGRSM